MNKNIILLLFTLLLMVSCQKGKSNAAVNTISYEQKSPDFNADTAYHYIEKQILFGNRVPNSKGHTACGDFLIDKLKEFGANVTVQSFNAKAYDGTILKSRNIIGSYDNGAKSNVLLFAHWDTRPYSDQDKNTKNYNEPLDGANDGASGVGVLLELARNIQKKKPDLNVDIILFDAEDYGPPAFLEKDIEGDWWGLGSQHWGKNPHKENYKARYGILLDMVGGKGAKFYRETFSMHYARDIVDKVWSTARKLGYGHSFISKDGGGVVDDHLYVNQYRHIPSIDIIEYHPDTEKGFGDFWHTQNDNMENISKETLKAVGQTVMEVIYTEIDL